MTVSNAEEFGIGKQSAAIDFSRIIERKRKVVEDLRDGVAQLLKGVNVIHGEAAFSSRNEVVVNGEIYTAPLIIIATGSVPAVLDIPGKELALTSDGILSIEKLPKSLAVIGEVLSEWSSLQSSRRSVWK